MTGSQTDTGPQANSRRTRSDDVAAVVELVARRFEDEDRVELATAFGRAALRRVTARQLADSDPGVLADELVRALEFVDRDRSGAVAVRAFNPSAPDTTGPATVGQGTVIQVCGEDRPFLLTTVTEELERLGCRTRHIFHPVLGVTRDPDGRLTEVLPARGADTRESLVHVTLDERLDEPTRVERSLRDVLDDLVAATGDFHEMQQRVERTATELRGHVAAGRLDDTADEAAALLTWLLNDNFLLLGCRDYAVDVEPGDTDDRGLPRRGDVDDSGRAVVRVVEGSGLGLLTDDETSRYSEPVPLTEADQAFKERHVADAPLTVSRSHRYSTVREHSRLLNIWVKRYDDDGRTVGQFRLLGLLARKADTVAASDVPVLRRKLDQILVAEDIVEQSHDERAMIRLFRALPKDELLERSVEQLRVTLAELLEAEEDHETHILVHDDPITANVSVVVSIPRERYDPDFRRRVQTLLRDEFDTDRVEVDLSLGDRQEAVIRFGLHAAGGRRPGRRQPVDAGALTSRIHALARTWSDELEATLVDDLGPVEGGGLYSRFGRRLPDAYRDHTPVGRAVADVRLLDELRHDDDIRIVLHDDPVSDRPLTRLKVLKAGPGIELSAILPGLESLGLTVTEELPFRLSDNGSDTDSEGDSGSDVGAPGQRHPPREFHIHDYGVHDDGRALDVAGDGSRLAATVRAIWDHELEVDSLNRLVLRAGLDWADVVVLRAYRRYRRQIGTAYTAGYQNETLAAYPRVVNGLIDLFAARFDPDRTGSDDELVQAQESRHQEIQDQEIRARRQVLDALDSVERLDHDRILRAFLTLIEATVRTNRHASDDPARVTLKFDSGAVGQLPTPVPHREVFVYSPEVEGIHLRAGRVARGGIRWSERRDDLRTEILDLMRTQMLKNAVIVPTGAKGGFVCKRDPATVTGAWGAEISRQYRTFISSLLEITDNRVAGDIIPPPDVRRHDGDDPYLVVAADRGTAALSDTANEIANEHGFWLGDAFASGGSRGYDHKGLGITARGAWVAVRRHFRELGIDVQTEPITVVGVGDMSGDVFGNGMLRSRALKLVAAFDHRDIFIDPDPDPQRSYTERRRLFTDPELTWQDYDRDAISEGGGVWSRTDKTVTLSDQVRDVLALDVTEVSPPQLIRAILAAPVDLLFTGGIGTFVKAPSQSHEDIGDRANDEIRIDATDLRARVIGEGANLAVTQQARAIYARRGGRLNTDFIDNAAGVDISDHEVNLKILLRLATERGQLDVGERDRLLTAVTDDVVAACLADVQSQTWSLSHAAADSSDRLDAYGALIGELESEGLVDRGLDALPSTEQMLERADIGAGLTRPELAVLLVAEKRRLFTLILTSGLCDQPGLASVLRDYFPDRLTDRFASLLDDHPLRRELIATGVTNDTVNRMGPVFVHRLSSELGIADSQALAAYWIARGVAAAPALWDAAERADRHDPGAGLRARRRIDDLLASMTRSYLHLADLSTVGQAIEQDRGVFEAVEEIVTGRTDRRGTRTQRAGDLVDLGLDTAVAVRLAGVSELAITPHVGAVSRALGRPPRQVAEVFLGIDDALGLSRLRALVARTEPDDQWERWQHRGMIDDLAVVHRTAAQRALAERPDGESTTVVNDFVASHRDGIDHTSDLIGRIEADQSGSRMAATQVVLHTLRTALRADTDDV